VSKTVKGGKRFGFAALWLSATARPGWFGHGKAREVPEAIAKATAAAKKAMIRVPLRDGARCTMTALANFGAGRVAVRSGPGRDWNHRRAARCARFREPWRCRRL